MQQLDAMVRDHLKDGMKSSQNNFDLIRLVLAIGVVLGHLYDLTLNTAFLGLRLSIDSESCVYCFFTISGFLVTLSFVRSSSLRSFYKKRVRRILPAYVAVILFSVFLGAMLTRYDFLAYVTSAETWNYLLWNLAFLNMVQPSLPGVFENNPVNAAMNGSLWSIRSEVLFYLLIPFWMYFCRKFGNLICWLLVLASVQCADLLVHQTAWGSVGSLYLIHIGYLIPFAFFTTGSLLYIYREQIEIYALRVLPACLLMFFGTYLIGKENMPLVLRVVPLALMVIIVGGYFHYLGNWGRYGDLSYGIYVYHYPILQTLIAIGILSTMPLAGAVIAIVLTVAAGLVSWHWIEKPFLSKKSHYVQAEEAAIPAMKADLNPV